MEKTMMIVIIKKILLTAKITVAAILLSISVVTACHAAAVGVTHKNYTLDVFKSSQVTAEEIDQKYGKQLDKIASAMLHSTGMASVQTEEMSKLFETVMTGIHDSGNFVYLGLSPITYPGGDKIGFTVDIVDKKDKDRLDGFHAKPTGDLPDPNHLIASWIQYDAYGFDKFYRTKANPDYKNCPAFHCSFGFDDPALRPYGKKFNAEVPIYKNQLIAILHNDKNDIKRSAAAYLLAHLKNGNEIIEILTPSIRDASSEVRNSTLRVLAQTVLKVPNPDFPAQEVVRALRFPATVDRNKALYLMESLATHPQYARYFREHACFDLLAQLLLLQPNLHDNAYNVLRIISHKQYGSTDYQAWQNWAASSCAK
jgi:hypothetical protein